VRSARLLLVVPAVLFGWVFADLYFRVSLPGASQLEFLVFRAAAVVVNWLGEGDGHRTLWVLGALATLTVVAWTAGRAGAPLRQGGGLLFAAVQLVLLVLAALMERGMFAGLVFGLVLAVRL